MRERIFSCGSRVMFKTIPSNGHARLLFHALDSLRKPCPFCPSFQHRWFSGTDIRPSRPDSSNNDVIKELEERGLLAQVTSRAIRQHLLDGPRTVYLGVDPTAKSLHVGNLLAFVALLHFKLKGHQTILLLGGATGSIGDPSGRLSERVALTEQVLKSNVTSIRNQLEDLLASSLKHVHNVLSSENPQLNSATSASGDHHHSSAAPMIKNNLEWTKDLPLLEFLNSVGRLSRVSSMLARDSVKQRLESGTGISFTELTYQLLQAYDFVQLRSRLGCTVQIGGSDQYGNIMSGIELLTRMQTSTLAAAQQEPSSDGQPSNSALPQRNSNLDVAYGLTIPLLTTSKGEKFGKSAGNAVWLDPNMTSPIQFYQTFMSIPDSEVTKYLKMFTFFPLDELERKLQKFKTEARPDRREPQKLLAREVTLLVHGERGLQQALLGTEFLFPTNKISHNLGEKKQWTRGELDQIFENMPNWTELNSSQIIGHSILDISVLSGLCESKSEAKRLIKSGGIKLNHVPVIEVDQVLLSTDLIDSSYLLLIRGKNHASYQIIKVT